MNGLRGRQEESWNNGNTKNCLHWILLTFLKLNNDQKLKLLIIIKMQSKSNNNDNMIEGHLFRTSLIRVLDC